MYNYTICNQADAGLFCQQCKALKDNIPGIKEECLLEDVDGTATAEYSHPKGRVIVKNDYQVNAIYVISDFDLLPYFQ